MQPTQNTASVIRLESRGIYQITVQGSVNPEWCDRLGGMTIVRYHTPAEDASITVLTGELIDQAALLGILDLLYNAGFPLLAVERLSADAATNA